MLTGSLKTCDGGWIPELSSNMWTGSVPTFAIRNPLLIDSAPAHQNIYLGRSPPRQARERERASERGANLIPRRIPPVEEVRRGLPCEGGRRRRRTTVTPQPIT